MIGTSIPDSAPTNGTPVRSTNDSLVDSALEALGDLAGPPDNVPVGRPARKTVPGKKQQPKEDAPDAPEDDEQDEGPDAAEADEEGDEEQPQEASDEDEVEEHDARGSKDEPFKVKDLPDDKFIELKVDGEKQVVSLKELANGYIREQTFGQRLTKTKALADEAQQHAQRFVQEREQLRSATREFLHDPEQLYEYFTATEEREAVVMQLAQRIAAQLRTFRENPEARLQYQRQRDMKRIEEERQRFEQQKQAELQARQQQEAQQRFEQVFKPGWTAGLRKAGFPEPTQALWDEVMVRLNQRHASGKAITSDDVAEFVFRAARLLELPSKAMRQGKPKPAPVPAPKERTQKRGKDAWADKPQHKRTADPDYFLRNLRPRDFR